MATSAPLDRLETSAFAFASDLAGEGVDAVLENIQNRGGLGGITVAFSYHAARDIFPHNPRQKVQVLDRGELFYPPDEALYDRLRIRPPVNALAATGVIEETCLKARERGLQVHAWTTFFHTDWLDTHQDCVTRNAFGDPLPSDLCPANPDSRAYARALAADLTRHDVASIMAESLHFHVLEHGYHHERYFIDLGPKARYLLGLCFCDHCLERAGTAGVDGERVRDAVRAELEQVFDREEAVVQGEVDEALLAGVAAGQLDAYLRVRADTVTTLTAEAAEIAAAAGTRFVFCDPSGAVKGYETGRPTGGPAAEISWRLGVDLRALGRVSHGFAVLAYAADVDRVRLDLEAYERELSGLPVTVCLRPSPPDCESVDNLAAKLALARELGLTGVHFYHYGFLRLEALDMIRAAMERG